MSEIIDNQRQRQQMLKAIIKGLHQGVSLEDAKKEFKKHFQSITTEEITAMEQGLIKEGMNVTEIQKLCDVHAAVFDGSISDIHSGKKKDFTEALGHPVQVFLEENARLEKLLKEEVEPFINVPGKTPALMLRIGFDRLKEIEKHYARKEYLFFPHLEKKGITAPPKVMWGVDDEIRAQIKEVIALLSTPEYDEKDVWQKATAAVTKVRDMISKENNILIPLLKGNLTFFNWISVDSASPEVGYFLEKPKVSWKDEGPQEEQEEEPVIHSTDAIPLGAGGLTSDELTAMLNSLPLDMTFVDAEGHVKYFTQGKERIFVRPLTVIGRHVSMCHPPASVAIVEGIIESFRNGTKDHEDFWIQSHGKFIYIRYFAVRSPEGKFLGTLELTQDIQPIRDLQGEKRLVSK